MRKPNGLAMLVAAGWLVLPQQAMAHSPLLVCFYDDETTIFCEAGYSDGASASGGVIQVLDGNQRLLFEGTFGADSTYTFTRPDVDFFQIDFVGDSTHVATVFDDEIY